MIPAVDAHAHLGFAGRVAIRDGGVDDVLALLDTLGIGTAICSHHADLFGNREQGRREIVAAYERSQGRLLAYAVFWPWGEDAAAWVRDRLLSGRPYVGIKLHPTFHELSADDEAYRPAWELAAEYKVPLLVHTGTATPWNPDQGLSSPGRLERWVVAFPQVQLILGHAGGRVGGHRAAIRLAHGHPNVYLDLAGDSYTWGLIEHLVAQVGAARVLYASDFTWVDPRTHLGRVLAAELSAHARQQILHDNAARLFRLEPLA